MRKNRGILAVVCVVILGGASLAAGWVLLSDHLPDPAHADRDALMRWMVLRDLTRETPQTRRELIDRLQSELKAGVDLKKVNDAVSDERRERFWRNIDLLLCEWFEAKADALANLKPQQQAVWVHQQLDDVLAWKTVVDMRKQHEGKGEGGTAKLMQIVQEKVDGWIEHADPQQAARMQALQGAIRTDVAIRYFAGLMLPTQGDSSTK